VSSVPVIPPPGRPQVPQHSLPALPPHS
jgi:hypothetical protein